MINVLFALCLLFASVSVKADSEVITDTKALSDKEVEVTKTVVQTVDIAKKKRMLANVNAMIQKLQDQKASLKAQIDAAKAIGVDPAETAPAVITVP